MIPRCDLTPRIPARPAHTPEFPPDLPPDLDQDCPRELEHNPWDAFLPDDDYEPQPEFGDFWPELDADVCRSVPRSMNVQ